MNRFSRACLAIAGLVYSLSHALQPIDQAKSFTNRRPRFQPRRSGATSSWTHLQLSPFETDFASLLLVDAAQQSVSDNVTQEPLPLSSSTNIAVFVAGLVPFAWATVEFWRRIAVGEPFGTGSDSVVIIGEDDAPESSRGRRVLGKDALVVAYILFTLATATLGVVVYSVVTSPSAPPPTLP